MQAICDPTTDAHARKVLIQDLANENGNERVAIPTNQVTTQQKITNSDTWKNAYLLTLIPIMNISVQRLKTTLRMTDALPHIKWPVGNGKSVMWLLIMVDTGAGLNLGRKKYHRAIYEKYPELVEVYEDVGNQEPQRSEHLRLRGIDPTQAGPEIDALIVYKTPFVTKGEPVLLTIGLAENTATNTLLGIPTIKIAQMVMMFNDQDIIYSPVLSHQFKVEYQVPHMADGAPNVQPEQQAVLMCNQLIPRSEAKLPGKDFD